MAEKIAEKLADLEYNEQVAIAIVERDEDLKSFFLNETKLKTFTLIRTLVKENQLSASAKAYLRKLFDSIIMTKPSLIDQYHQLLVNGEIEDKVIVAEPSVPTVIEEVVEKTAEIITAKVKKVKSEDAIELPRRYGKEKIMADIQAQGGKATPLQNAMLKVNDLKNIYVNLSARGIKDMVGGSKLISDEDSRKIVSAITIVERQLADILKKK
jgi:hypothetical protein